MFENYAHYSDKSLIFSSDVIQYLCAIQAYTCHSDKLKHLRRILTVRKDQTTAAVNLSEIKLAVQSLLSYRVLESLKSIIDVFEVLTLNNELFFVKNVISYVSESDIEVREMNIIFNYWFYEISDNNIFDHCSHFLICWVILNIKTQLISLSTSLTEELKLLQYNQQHFLNNFQWLHCVCLPYLMFIDGFELYHNIYCTLMSFYMTLSDITVRDWSHHLNVFSIILESHDSSFDNVVLSLSALKKLNERLMMKINEQKTFIYAFIQVFIENMSQQQNNSEFMHQNIN